MSLHAISKLELRPKENPRDKRVHERIQAELEPVAEDILREYRAGLTEEEILERAEKRKRRRNNRQKARERARATSATTAEDARQMARQVDPDVRRRVAELTRAGPVPWGEIRDRLRSEGITWSDVQPLQGDPNFSFQTTEGGRRVLQRA